MNTNTDLLARYETWLLSSDRAAGTINLRMRHMRELGARYDLITVTDDDLEHLMGSLRARGLADETRKSIRSSWCLFFGWALRKGHRRDDPAFEFRPIRVHRKMPRLAADEAIEEALMTATLRDRALLLVARDGWLRLTELTTLHTTQRSGDRLHIVGKGGRERIVYLTFDAVAALKELERVQGAGYYFPGHAKVHLHPQSVHKIIKRLTGHHPHALRHKGATEAFRASRNIRAVQEQLGHASVATTQIYTHLTDDERRAVVVGGGLRAA